MPSFAKRNLAGKRLRLIRSSSVLRRGVVKSENAVITSLVTKEEVQAAEVDEVVERTFEGNIPQFLAAFTRNRKLSKKEIDEIQKMIDDYKED